MLRCAITHQFTLPEQPSWLGAQASRAPLQQERFGHGETQIVVQNTPGSPTTCQAKKNFPKGTSHTRTVATTAGMMTSRKSGPSRRHSSQSGGNIERRSKAKFICGHVNKYSKSCNRHRKNMHRSVVVLWDDHSPPA